MIITCTVLGYETNGIGHRHQSRTLMTVDPVTTTAHTVDVDTGAVPGPRTAPDSAPLCRVVVRTMMGLGMVHLAPTIPVSSKESDVVGQRLW